MTLPFLKKLAELEDAAPMKEPAGWRTYPIFGENYAEIHGIQSSDNTPLVLDSQPNASLICLLRNNTAAIRELVEAAEEINNCSHVKALEGTPLGDAVESIKQALAAFKGE